MKCEIDNFRALHEALARMCGDFCDLPEEALFRCRLVANELLSNVLQHGGERAFFQAAKTETQVILSVRSLNAYRPPEKSVCADVYSECGRGLFLVDAMCLKREYNESDGTKVYIAIGKSDG